MFTNSANMGMPIPNSLNEPGPQYANDVNQCLNILDGHTHAPGLGVQIGSLGLNLQSDLSFNVVNATNLRSVRFISTTASSGTDIGCIYVKGVDLFYNDLNANVVRITNNGGLASTGANISVISTTAIISATGPNPATSGFIRMNNNTDFVSWRNAANNADDKIWFDSSDNFNLVGNGIVNPAAINGLTVGGGIYGEGQNGIATKINASSGQIGEYLFSNVNATASAPVGSSAGATNSTFAALNLSIGDWDISGKINFSSSAVTEVITTTINISQYAQSNIDSVEGINSLTTLPAGIAPANSIGSGAPMGSNQISAVRLSTSASTNVFLNFIYSSTGANSGHLLAIRGGQISARRMR